MSGLKYKIGDKVLVEGYIKDDADHCPYADEDRPYWVICDGNGVWASEDIVHARKDDMDDWKLAGEVMKMPWSTALDIFGGIDEIVEVFEMDPADVRAAIDRYYASKPRIGDVVECNIASTTLKGILVGMNGEGYYWVLVPNESSPRKIHIEDWTIRKVEDCKIDIAKALEEIK